MINIMRKKFQERRDSEEKVKPNYNSPSSTPKCQSPADSTNKQFAWPETCEHCANGKCPTCAVEGTHDDSNEDMYIGQICSICGQPKLSCCCNKPLPNRKQYTVPTSSSKSEQSISKSCKQTDV